MGHTWAQGPSIRPETSATVTRSTPCSGPSAVWRSRSPHAAAMLRLTGHRSVRLAFPAPSKSERAGLAATVELSGMESADGDNAGTTRPRPRLSDLMFRTPLHRAGPGMTSGNLSRPVVGVKIAHQDRGTSYLPLPAANDRDRREGSTTTLTASVLLSAMFRARPQTATRLDADSQGYWFESSRRSPSPRSGRVHSSPPAPGTMLDPWSRSPRARRVGFGVVIRVSSRSGCGHTEGHPRGGAERARECPSAHGRPVDHGPSRARHSSSENSRERMMNRTPSGASTENPLPRPLTTSTVRWVCFQYSNWEPDM